MTQSPQLPPELLRFIVTLTPTTGLLALRAANKTLYGLATPPAFRVLTSTSTVKSTARLRALLSSGVRDHVEEIVYRDWYETEGAESEESKPPNDDEEKIRVNLVGALEQLHTLPALHALSLVLHPMFNEPTSAYIDEEESAGLSLQLALFSALAALSPKPALRSLTLENIIPFPNPIFSDPNFLAISRGVEHFCLSTVSDTVLEGAIYQDPLVDFYTVALPPLLIAPLDTVTSLSFHPDQDVGSIPGLSLGALHYPRLTNLSFHHVLFDPDTGVEAFIIAHAQTLTTLTLFKCKVALSEDDEAPARTWAQIYRALGDGLPRLGSLEITEDWHGADYPDGNPAGRKLRYTRWDSGWGWNPYFGESEDVEEGEDDGNGVGVWDGGDANALDAFRELVRARASGVVRPASP